MAYSKFRLWLIVRVWTLVITSIALTILYYHFRLHYTTVVLLAIMFIEIAEMIRYVTRTHQELERALKSILADDFSTRFSKSKTRQHPLLGWSNAILTKLTEMKSQHQFKTELLISMIDELPIGVICSEKHDDILLTNHKALEIANSATLQNFQQLKRVNPALHTALESLHVGQEKKIVLRNGQHDQEFIIELKELKIAEYVYNIFIFLNTTSDFDQRETESFKNFMRVLHHEIVNSITPIISLSDSVHSALKDPTSGMTNDEVIEASSAILKRSKGLLKFSTGYRALTDIPTITTTLIQPAEILEKTVRLFGDVRQKQIRTIIETRAMITADESQIEQVLINLIKNAIESVPENKTPEIQLLISEQAHELRISVSDNGIGMNDEVLANIYVPYFTTKKEGQGIGMSLCRQFVLANKGKIYIASTPEQGTTVQLAFPVAV